MSTRHQRRKAAKVNAQRKLEGLAQAARSANIAKIVRDNKSRPIERNYFAGTTSSVYAGGFAARARGLGVSYR
jgi:hypothetical protein